MTDSEILSIRSLVNKNPNHSKSTNDADLIEGLLDEKIDEEAEDENVVDDEVVQTPPPSPACDRHIPRPSLFSLAQVSSKLGELWSSARESIFGEDYWIPSDANEIVLFPLELLRAHKIIFPTDDLKSQLKVVQGSVKNKPAEPLHHVVFSVSDMPNAPSYSLFRSTVADDAVDLCRRCVECKILFKILDRSKDTKKPIGDLMAKLRQYPLYRMIHIAIACDRLDLFDDNNIEYLNSENNSFQSLMKMMIQPEGKYPLHLAIEMHRLKIVRRMLKLGADASVKDINGNNAIHYASLASVQMLELLWEFNECHGLINQTNNEGYVPVMLAIRAANPRCLATLLNFGAELSMRVQGRNPLFEAMQSKGKNADIIKAIIEASPDLVKERDSSGNSALHVAMYKTPLMGLLFLKCKEGEIGLMITLLSYCCDIDAQDNDGNTALHIAVSKRNNEATRLLLCLGANPNLTNSNDDTPRHLAARLKDLTKSVSHRNMLLKSLIMCGALTCAPKKVGCVSGCVNEAMKGFSYSSFSNDCDSPRKFCDESPYEAYSNPIKVDHPIRDYMQKTFYDTLIARLDELDSRGEKPSNMVNLLSLDGGGIRGLVILQILMAVEEELNEPIYPYFDWVAGTSTGALVATALAQGKTLRECQHIYLRFKDLIFDGWTRPYNSTVLEMFMKESIGHENLNEIKYPRLMISTVRADFFPVKLEFMRNYRLPLSDDENSDLGFSDPAEIPTWKALRRTSAAPMFFSPVDDKYIDGGIIANNPTLDLLAEVQLYNGINTYLNRPEDKVEIGCVLSLGTGQIPLSPLDPLHVEIFNPISSAFTFRNLSLILVDQVTATEGAPVDRSRSWCNAIGVPFFRLSAPLHKDIGLGTKDDHDIAHMMWDCIEYTHRNRAYIKKLCTLLKRIGKTPERPRAFSIK
ncbi:ankyrin repeat protein [Dictyocaulus viviparus]|uniref:phospholipase A2 n=1 Tax=Dictyocaulus viviparus TaxID=29172 RepID=A0A0D8XAI0_DICVI|nr:ankyrin repeat protein [Dictyocaulus viviparus]